MEAVRNPPGSEELANFCKQESSKQEFTDELREILEVTARTGLYWHEWDQLKMLLSFRLKQVLQDYHKSHIEVAVGPPRPLITGERYQELEDRLTSGLDSFRDGAPFTIQRLCEVLLNPRDRYPNLDKVALAFEKLLLVTSTVPVSSSPYPAIAPASIKEIEIQQHSEVPKATTENDVPQETVHKEELENPDTTKVEPEASLVRDEEMVDVENRDAKEPFMEVDVPQAVSDTTNLTGESLMESVVMGSLAGGGEWQPVEEAAVTLPTPLIVEEEPMENSVMVETTPESGGQILLTQQ